MLYFSDVQDLIDEACEQVRNSSTPHRPHLAGLDLRCGEILVGEDFIASLNTAALDYYGGFEYVQAEHVLVLGKMKVYSIESERVARCLAALEHNCD